MIKQFLNRLPRKSAKSDTAAGDYPATNSEDIAIGSSPIQRTNSGVSMSGRSSVAVKRTSFAVFPASVVTGIEPLLSFKDVPNSEKQILFISKLNICSVVFDFSDSNKNVHEKDMKRQILLELVDHINSGSARFTEPVMESICKMFAVNLFRVLPPSYRSNSTGHGATEIEEDEPLMDPAWSHLQIVYDLLLKFVASTSVDAKLAKKYIDHSFVFRFLELFNSEDPRERDCLKTILHRIYGKFMVHRPFIRKAVSNIFYRFIFETECHNGIAELLEIMGSVVAGFALPLKEEHKIFLSRALLPLHKSKSVNIYLQQLSYCVTQFIEKEPKLATTVIRGLLKYWPVTNSQKEVMFLSELEEVLEATIMAEFQKNMVPLFRRIACCLNSSHFQVAERALFLWNNDHIVSLIAQNRQVILALVFPALEKNGQNHWNQSVLNLTLNVRKMFSEMDEEQFRACENKFEEEEAKARAAVERRQLAWEHLEAVVRIQQSIAGNAPVLVTPLTRFSTANLN